MSFMPEFFDFDSIKLKYILILNNETEFFVNIFSIFNNHLWMYIYISMGSIFYFLYFLFF